MNLKRSLALALTVMMLLGVALPAAFGADTLERIAGSNRWATAVEISKEGWSTAGTVVLANGMNYPDALAGVSLAHSLNAPILLTQPTSLVAETKAEIVRLGAAKVIILGGTGVISAAVATELEGMGLTVERISGDDRFETAAAVAKKLAPAGVDTVVLASGRGFADALAAASYAAVKGYPILLTEMNSCPEATKKAIEDLGATKVLVIGGTGVISASAVAGLPGVERIFGSNREATSVELAKYFAPQTNKFFIATGDGFADAITGAVLAAKQGTGILLVRGSFPAVVGDFFASAQVVEGVIFGGTNVVSANIATTAAGKLVPAGGTGVAGWITNGAGATVSIGGKTGTVSDTNFYRIVGVAPGEHTMTVTKPNHAPKTAPVKVVKDNISILNTTLASVSQAAIEIKGSVINKATGYSLDGATVSVDIWNKTTNQWDLNQLSTTTDGNGIFTVANADSKLNFGSQVRVNVKMAGFTTVPRTVTLKLYDEVNVLDGFELVQIKNMILSGKVTSGTLNIQDAEVVLYSGTTAVSPTGVDVIKTNVDGEYALPALRLASGSYKLEVTKAGYAVYTANINITEGANLTHNAVLAPGYNVTFNLAPTALSEDFAAGSFKATLIRNGVEYASKTVVEGSDTDNVQFVFGDQQVAPGTYTLRVTGDHAKTKDFPITVVNAAVTAHGRTDFAGKISGVVNTSATVELLNDAGNVIATTTANKDTGAYAFTNLNAGKYNVRASKEGFITATFVTGTTRIVLAVNDTETATFTLDPNPVDGDISGVVRTSGTLLPAAGASIDYYALNVRDAFGDLIEVGTLIDSDSVDSDGSYGFTNLLPGTYTVVIRHVGSHETLVTTQAIAAGDDIAKNYLLEAGGNAKIVLTVTASSTPVTTGISIKDSNGKTDYTPTVADNKVTFSGLSAGTYTVTMTATDHQQMVVPVTVAKSANVSRTFELTPDADLWTVYLGVTGTDHSAIEGAEIFVFDAAGKAVNLGTVETSSTGLANFDVVNGSYKVAVYMNGFLFEERNVTVKDANVSIPVVVLTAW